MIPWENLASNSHSEEQLGAELKQIYVDLIVGASNFGGTPFQELLTEIMEDETRRSADLLRQSYGAGINPREDDSARVADAFARRILKRFQNAICAEMMDYRDLPLNSWDLVVILTPTIITILGLPPALAAIAIPISVVAARIGVRSLCAEYKVERDSKEFLEERIKLHRRNILFLEAEANRYASASIPDVLAQSIQREESKLKQLEGRTLGQNTDSAKLGE